MRTTILLIVTLCLGILAGYFLTHNTVRVPQGLNEKLHSDPPATTRQHEDHTNNTIIQLQQRLSQTEQEQQLLAARISELESVIGKSAVFLNTGTAESAAATSEKPEQPSAEQNFRTSVEALIATGISTEQAAFIQSRLDEYDLKQLYLKDRASREGWINTARYRKEWQQAQTAYRALRSEIGDDAYDRMLYALGQANRIVVRDIMQNSSADQYGLQANDRVLEYDGQRVFNTQELNNLVTQGGDSGALVLMRVQRDEELIDFYIPRGPIGIRLASSRELPRN